MPKYHALIRAGILNEDDPVELLEGEIVVKMPKNPSHENARRMFRRAVERLLPPGYFVDDRAPVTTSDSESEPDVCVVRGAIEQFGERHPRPAEVALIIEVAESSLQRDRERKQRVYARGEVPVYWVVNLIDRQVECFSGPVRGRNPRYQRCDIYRPGDTVPVVIDGREIGRLKLADLLSKKGS